MTTGVDQMINVPQATSPSELFSLRRRRISLPGPRLRVSERKLLLLVLDALAIHGALLLALLLRTEFIASVGDVLALGKWFFTLTLVWLACAHLFDCYDLSRAGNVSHSVRCSSFAVLGTVLAYTSIPWFTPPLTSRSLIGAFGLLALGGITAWRAIYAQLLVQPWLERRALIVGAGRVGRYLAATFNVATRGDTLRQGTGYRLLGFVDDPPHGVGAEVEGLPVLGERARLALLAQEHQVDELILALDEGETISDDLMEALLRCRELGLPMTTVSILCERMLGRVPIEYVGRDLYMVVSMEETATTRLYRVFKRGLDILSALVGLPILGLLLPFIALGNALTSPGPLFYRQRRVGKGGRCFDMFKLRSMAPNAEKETGAIWAGRDDERITPVGRILRRTRLDELPQFVNVLRGEMSLIGPRPERPEFVDILAQELPFYRARHAVKPGLTGWAQVRYRYGSSVEDAKVKLEYDLYYLRHAGLLLELTIFMQTIPVMLKMEGY